MAQGNYDHPSYLTRQVVDMDSSVAGANLVSAGVAFPMDMRLRKVTATVRTAGTSAAGGNAALMIYIGTSITGYGGTTLTTNTTTATLGTIVLGSSTANVAVNSTDMNARLVAGGVLAVKNGTDATGVSKVCCEMHVDPAGTWS